MRVFYQRVSTLQQKTDRQEIKAEKGVKIFTDKVSGAVPFAERPAGKQLLDAIEKGKVTHLTVSSIDRLGRDSFNIQSTIDGIINKGVTIRVLNLDGLQSHLDNGKPNSMFKLITDVLSNVAQMERDSIKERQKEGIAIAKAKGVYRGRPIGTGKEAKRILDENKDIVKRLKEGQSIRNSATLTGKSPTTVQKVKKAMIELS